MGASVGPFPEKYLEEHPVDAIVTTGPPQSMHLIGLRLSQATGIPWVADFRDPWTKMFYFKHLGLTSWAEKSIIGSNSLSWTEPRE